MLLSGWQGIHGRMVVETTQSAKLPSADLIFGRTAAMRDVRAKFEQAQEDDLPLLIEGEHGAGKELAARYLHTHSARAEGAFVRVNCGGMPAKLLECEMFGSTGAIPRAKGSVELSSLGMAEGGTLFLDEIADLDPTLQQRVVDVLAEARRAGESSRGSRMNARVVCASSVAMEKAVARGRILEVFGQAFGHRVRLLPLRERKQDIPELCEYLVGKFARSFGRPVPVLNPYVLDAFQQWNWPGNIRELENWIARIVIFGIEEAIGLEFMRQIGSQEGTASRRHRAVYGRRSGRRNG